MSKITPESIAKLKALFQDNEKALGSNFSQLIDFFNDNKVTDNGDGTYSVGDINLDASKLYDLIRNTGTGPLVTATDFNKALSSKADDSKVVHTADMRKPANDVAGIEEVNTKQDKIGYTPADDSKVVHTSDMRKPANDVVGLEDITQTALPDGTDFYTLLNTAGRPLQYFADGLHSPTMINKPKSALSAFILITSAVNNRPVVTYNYTFLNLRDVSTGDSYEALINTDGTGKIVVTRPWHKLADDSKVAHLSGTNNFDTVPTVNNNPLLLASSLPSDLARTGQANTFSKQQIFSTNPTNGTQVYPIYATVGTDADATTLITSLQSSGFSGMIGVPES